MYHGVLLRASLKLEVNGLVSASAHSNKMMPNMNPLPVHINANLLLLAELRLTPINALHALAGETLDSEA